MISSLQALRFIFALFIFAQHFPLRDGEPEALLDGTGPMGVSFFLVLSGFVMSLGYADKVRLLNFSWGDFMKKRLIRLWPLHILCLLIWIVAASRQSTFSIQPLPLLGNFFLLQSWIPMVEAKGNAVAWCLSDLIFFYALFPWLIRLRAKQLVLGVLAYFGLVLAVGSSLPLETARGFFLRDWFFYFFPLSRLVEFCLGIVVYHMYCRAEAWRHVSWWKRLSPSSRAAVELMPILFSSGVILLVNSYGIVGSNVYAYYLPSCLMIYVFALSHKSGNQGAVSDALSRPWLIYLGEISFSFYMIHYLVILIVNRVFSWVYPDEGWALRLVVTLGITIVGSILVNKYFERPVAELLSRGRARGKSPISS